MKLDLLSVGVGLLLSSCTGSPTTPKPSGPVAGWHDAGLLLSEADQQAGGVQYLAVVGSRLIAGTTTGRLFIGTQGSQAWDTLPVPGGDSVYWVTSKDSSVYVGTRTPGKGWRLDFPDRTWTNLGLPSSGSVYVDYIVPWGKGLLAGTFDVNTAKVQIFTGNKDLWNSSVSGFNTSGDDATMALSLDSVVYATTYHTGLWRRSSSDTAWNRVPDPVVPILQANGQYSPGTLDKPRSLAWYHGQLWVGYLIWKQIVRGSGLDSVWSPTGLDTGAFPGHVLPKDILTLFVWKDRLFAGGSLPEVPLVYNESTGWKYITQNWGKSDDGSRTTCSNSVTLSFAAIGDTLYAAGCGHIYKLPASQVPQ
jgi:hypothetical protein